jgi:hypothetical protein
MTYDSGINAFEKACSIVNSFLTALRYKTGQLQVYPLTPEQFRYNCISKTGIDGRKAKAMISLPNSSGMPGLPIRGEYWLYGAQEVQDFVQSGEQIGLCKRILCDAYAFFEMNDIAHAILEATIAAEVLVRSHIREDIIAENPKNWSLINLFDAGLKAIGKKSFKDECSDGFKNLDFLFRTRNKIAHEAKLGYKDDMGCWHDVDKKIAMGFLDTVQNVLMWLGDINMPKRPSVLSLIPKASSLG